MMYAIMRRVIRGPQEVLYPHMKIEAAIPRRIHTFTPLSGSGNRYISAFTLDDILSMNAHGARLNQDWADETFLSRRTTRISMILLTNVVSTRSHRLKSGLTLTPPPCRT